MLRDIKKLRVMRRASFYHSVESNKGKDHCKLGLQGKKRNSTEYCYIFYVSSIIDVWFLYMRHLRTVLYDRHKLQPLVLNGK